MSTVRIVESNTTFELESGITAEPIDRGMFSFSSEVAIIIVIARLCGFWDIHHVFIQISDNCTILNHDGFHLVLHFFEPCYCY
jgi:hypothetical protein